jgi:hypothetical protein
MFQFKRKTKAKEKRGTPHFKGEIIKRFPQEVIEGKRKAARQWIGWGCCGLLICGFLMLIPYDEYRIWRTLDTSGQVHQVPVLKLRKESCGQRNTDTCYVATYRYRDAAQEQSINRKVYSDLQGKPQVEIVASGSTTRIVGTEPNTTQDVLFYCFLGLIFGGLPMFIGVVNWLTLHNLRPRRRNEAGLWPYSW